MVPHEAAQSVSPLETSGEVLTVLADATCRAMLEAMADEALTAAELAETTGIPLSTVYRKLDQLIDTRLVVSTYRLGVDGKHPRQYRCNFDQILIQMAAGSERALHVSIR